MSPTASSRTLRLRGLKSSTCAAQLLDAVQKSTESDRRSLSYHLLPPKENSKADQPECFLAQQGDFSTGTITFTSAEGKTKAAKKLLGVSEWDCDDIFDGLTVLKAGENVDLDICAIHGLGGNGFDTWMGKSRMWLRDMLPQTSPFERSRIMTFGYDSTLVNKKSKNRVKDWADELLHSVGHLRIALHEQERPIIFICHSLGGIVAREAMIRLFRQPNQFDGIKLSLCGLIFLSTPHSGTIEADWNQFLLSLSEITLGVRAHAIVDQLSSFNALSVDSIEDFAAMTKMPPFHCFCEGQSTSVGGKERHIVTQASAGFCNHKADMVLDVDHHGICKWDQPYDAGYMNILAQLKKIRASLLSNGASDLAGVTSPVKVRDIHTQSPPGQPSIVAPHYPLSNNTKWYQGTDLRGSSRLIGRSYPIDNIITSLQQRGQPSQLIALTGIGGIGKTEILLEIAFQFRNVANVFFIKAHDAKSLDSALLDIAGAMGHDLLSFRYPNTDLASIWRTYGPTERTQAFKSWLGNPINQPSLFIVDDLDGLKDEDLMRAALPPEAQIILYSARDPTITENLDRESYDYHVPNMDIGELASLMENVLQKSRNRATDGLISNRELHAIARTVDGHTLGARRAISYVINILSQTTNKPAAAFLEIFYGSDWIARKDFLNYEPPFGPSVMETFRTSLQRVRRHHLEVRRFLELLAFLSSREGTLRFRDFLGIKRPWLEQLRPVLPDYDVFERGLAGHNAYLAELERVSIGVRRRIQDPLQIHSLWIECIQQEAKHLSRLQWLRQIMVLCHASWVRGEEETWRTLCPFAQNALAIASRFEIGLTELLESSELRDWAERIDLKESINPFDEAETIDETERSAHMVTDQLGVQLQLTREQHKFGCKMISLQEKCQQLAQDITRFNIGKLSEESFETIAKRFLALLRELQALETVDADDVIALAHRDKHLEVYEALIGLAPNFRGRNPMIVELLSVRKRTLIARIEGS